MIAKGRLAGAAAAGLNTLAKACMPSSTSRGIVPRQVSHRDDVSEGEAEVGGQQKEQCTVLPGGEDGQAQPASCPCTPQQQLPALTAACDVLW